MSYQGPYSPEHSTRSQCYLLEGELQGEGDFSDYEWEPLCILVFKGLFNPALFKPFLAKAHSAALLGKDSASQEQGEQEGTEQATETDAIPIPRMFLDVIKRQWASSALYSRPSNMENMLYSVDSERLDVVQVQKVDTPVAVLISSTTRHGRRNKGRGA